MKHYSLPWKAHGCAVYQTDDYDTMGYRVPGEFICGIEVEDGQPIDPTPERGANADFIVLACNSHYELVNALKLILQRGYKLDASDHALAVDALTKARAVGYVNEDKTI